MFLNQQVVDQLLFCYWQQIVIMAQYSNISLKSVFLDDYNGNGEPPTSLTNLFEYFNEIGIVPTHFDIICGLVYILMLETGFVPADYKLHENETYCFNYSRLVALSKQLSYTRDKNVYTFNFYIPPFTDCNTKVVCIETNEDIIVNGFVNGKCFSIILDPLLYFISSNVTNLSVWKLQNLQHLSRNAKDGICFKAKCVILTVKHVPFNCLADLPNEIIRKINCYAQHTNLNNVI